MDQIGRLRGWLLSHVEGDGLKATTIRSSIWSTGGFGAGQILRIASNLILTRLLAPEMFGLMALVTMVLAALQLFSDFGIRDALIRNPRGGERDFYSTAWTLQVIRGFILALAAIVVAYPLALVYDQPQMFPLLCVMSVAVAAQGFRSIAAHLQVREMRMRRVVAYQLCVQLLGLAATALLAFWLGNVWALAIGAVIAAFIDVALTFTMLPRYRERLLLDRDSVSQILSFGKWIFVATILTFAGQGGVTAAQGFLVPLDVLAFLSIAGNLSLVLAAAIQQMTGTVGMSAIARAFHEDPERAARGAAKIGRVVGLASTAGAIALSLVSKPLIEFVYDPRYADVGVYLQFLVLGVGAANLSLVYGAALLAMGRSRTHAVIRGVEAVARLGLMYAGFLLGGVIGMTLGLAAAGAVTLAANLVVARRGGYANTGFDLAALAALAAAAAVALASIEA